MVEDPAGRAEARPSVITNVNDPAGARSYTIYFVAGERSGDNHGAALLKALRTRAPKMQFLGRGGPQMRAIAGAKFRDWIEDTAVVGLWEVIRRYPFFRKQFQATISEIDAARPNAVVLIDYPGFNLRLARALRLTAHLTAADGHAAHGFFGRDPGAAAARIANAHRPVHVNRREQHVA